MIVVTTREEARAARARLGRLGFVPTMGSLHAGHLSLVGAARRDNEAVAVSVFVNPTQFGPSEDLDAYPRDLDGDLAKLEAAGVDLVWTPRTADIYPDGFDTWVAPGAIATRLEGVARPTHFRGVTTVLSVLFHVLDPQLVYFGRKDAQQVAVVKAMVRDLGFPVQVVTCPIVRESDGLALSSRNQYLGEGDRAAAAILHRALFEAERAWLGGQTDAEALRAVMRDLLAGEPRATVDYVSVADPRTLAELDAVDPTIGALASLAVRIGRPRLIDNVVLFPHVPMEMPADPVVLSRHD